MSNFKDVPIDPDTKIMMENEVEINGIDALIQQWSWEGIIAESVIFHESDVEDFNDEELFQIVKENYTVDSGKSYTVKRAEDGNEYTFVNINFQDFEDVILG